MTSPHTYTSEGIFPHRCTHCMYYVWNQKTWSGALRLVTYYCIKSIQCLNFMHYEGILVKKTVQELSDKNERG